MTTPAEQPCLLDLNDVDLRLSRGTEILAHEPGFATWTGTRLELGVPAHAAAWRHPRHTHHRYWQALDTSPLTHLGKRVRHAGDLAYLQLEALRRRAGNPQRVVLLHPGHWQRAQLGLLLGITEAAGFAVAGIVESSVAVGATLPPGTYHFAESCLEQTLVTALEVDATRASRIAQRAVAESGFLALERAVLEVIVAAFLQESRFDPLHDGATEQLLHDQLAEWLALLARREEISLVITHRGVRHLATLQRAAVAEALAPHRVALMQACGDGPALLDDRLARFPGLLDGWPNATLLPPLSTLAPLRSFAAAAEGVSGAASAKEAARGFPLLSSKCSPSATVGGGGSSVAAAVGMVLVLTVRSRKDAEAAGCWRSAEGGFAAGGAGALPPVEAAEDGARAAAPPPSSENATVFFPPSGVGGT